MDYTKRIIVKFAPPTSGEKARPYSDLCDQVAAITRGALVRPPSATGRAVFQVPASSDLNRLIDDVRKLQSVEYAEPDEVDRAQK